MQPTSAHLLLTATAFLLAGSRASAQEPIPYGDPIRLEAALKIVAAAEAEAKKHNWPVAIAIVDNSGFLVAFHRLDNTQLGSIEVAMEKAKTSVLFRRPTKVFEDTLAQGGAGLRVLRTGAMPVEGGLPILKDGKIIGAIGVSGVKPNQDGEVAQGALKAVETPKPATP
ncbi:GlcG/HbpS family heme-binding protein [Singulisphaera sp. PoT]|uniref:GlcG/HbpS family heme-binding protein n=1 Tax=Singulisphaera sp. PoT TaxID=3411797 RepID=UPI003BF468EA